MRKRQRRKEKVHFTKMWRKENERREGNEKRRNQKGTEETGEEAEEKTR